MHTRWLVRTEIFLLVFAQAAVQAQASIGMGAILNTGCSVDHDVRLADGVHICPGSRLAGGVQVGARSWMGIGSSVQRRRQKAIGG